MRLDRLLTIVAQWRLSKYDAADTHEEGPRMPEFTGIGLIGWIIIGFLAGALSGLSCATARPVAAWPTS